MKYCKKCHKGMILPIEGLGLSALRINNIDPHNDLFVIDNGFCVCNFCLETIPILKRIIDSAMKMERLLSKL